MRSDRRARRQERAREWGRRHPRLAFLIAFACLAGFGAICVAQLVHGAYLGRGWGISAVGGVVTAVMLSVAVWISRRDGEGRAGLRFGRAWLVLGLISASAIRFPFPLGPYGSVQAFFNVVHAALLGYAVVTCAVVEVLLVRGFLRRRGLAGRAVLRPSPVRATGPAWTWPAPDRGRLPARLRFPSGEWATWRAGHLTAANGTVTWVSLKGDVTVDLTSACQALSMQPAGTRKRQPRVTALATSSGLVEVDVTPRALETLASRTSLTPEP